MDTEAGGQSGATAGGRKVEGARYIIRKENWEWGGGLRRRTRRFDGSVQEPLNTEGFLQTVG